MEPDAKNNQAALEAALLMREVLCELVYQRRGEWDPEHPCSALELRSITPEAIVKEAAPLHLLGADHCESCTPEGLRTVAAGVLARMRASGAVPWHRVEQSEQPDEPFAELIEAARTILSAIRALPSWASESVGESISSLHRGKYDFEQAMCRAYDARRPKTLAAILPWLAQHPGPKSEHGVVPLDHAWWGRMGEGRRAFVCDGKSILIVDDVDDAPTDTRWGDPIAAEKTIEKVIPTVRAGHATYPAQDLVSIIESAANLRAGQSELAAARVRLWVGLAASMAGGAVTVSHGDGPYDPVVFAGPGWQALVMPWRAVDPGLPTAVLVGAPATEAEHA